MFSNEQRRPARGGVADTSVQRRSREYSIEPGASSPANRQQPTRSGPEAPSLEGVQLPSSARRQHRLPCPRCAKGRRDTALSVKVDLDGHAVWKCWRCGWVGSTARKRGTRSAAEAVIAAEKARREAEVDRESRRSAARALFRASRPIVAGDLAARYLEHRGLHGPWPPSLRTGSHISSSGRLWPALVAGAAGWPERGVRAVQVTPLEPPGRKAWTKPSRITLGDLTGAAVRLTPWSPGQRLVLTEGTEDGLAVALACPDVAVWAALGAWNVAWVLLPTGADIVLCLDPDETGQRAAREATAALWARGHRCRLAELPKGLDPNALLTRGAGS